MRSAYDFKCGVYIFGHIDTKFINGEMSRSDYVHTAEMCLPTASFLGRLLSDAQGSRSSVL